MPKMTEQQLEESLRKELVGDGIEEKTDDNSFPKDQPQEPAKEGDSDKSTPLYKVGNRELSPDQLYEEYKRLEAEFTRRSQRVKELEAQLTSKPKQEEEKRQDEPIPAADKIKEELRKLGVPLKEDLKEVLKKVKEEAVVDAVKTTSARAALNQALDELEEDFGGQEENINGMIVKRPKVDRIKILEFIRDNPSIDKSPLEIAKIVYSDDFIRYEVAKNLAQKGGSGSLPKTESQGLGGTPNPPTPRLSFKDGTVERALSELLKK
jgi:hypothetical protein